MKAVLVFCEGNHDIAFVTRSLGHVARAQWIDKPIAELPSPLGPRPDPDQPHSPKVGSLIARRYSNAPLDELRLRAAAHAPAPTFESIVQVDDVLYVLIRCHGDSGARLAIDLVEDFKLFLDPSYGTDINRLAAAFVFDADGSVQQREQVFASSYAPLHSAAPPSHGAWASAAVPVGLYVFHEPSRGAGTLEDLLGPLVAAEWPARWAAADTYLATHASPSDPVNRKPAERLKAQITVTGQFVAPGDPMSQIIERKGLSQARFGGQESLAVVKFLQGVPW